MLFTEQFKSIERNTGILDWEIDGIPLWRFERFTVHRYLSELEKKGVSSTDITRTAKGTNYKKYLGLFLKHPATPCKCADIMIFNHSRRVLQAGKYVCKYTEKISDNFPDSITYETPYNDSHFEPAATENLRYLDRIILKSYIYEIICRKCFKKSYRKSYQCISSKINALFGSLCKTEDLKYITKSMTKNLYLIKYREKKLRKIIKKVNPKVIIEVVGYSRNNMIVNELAKKLAIPTIELQHSQINNNMIQYMWYDRKDIDQFPDYLFTFGEFWADDLQLPIPDNHIKTIGFPYFEEQITLNKRKQAIPEKDLRPLFISQYLAGSSLYELALTCCQMNPELKIIYKLHPDEYGIWETRYPMLRQNKNIEVITDPSVSLYECFTRASAVIGIFSGALYEALAFDLPVYLYKADYIEYMQKLIDAKGAIVVETAEELLKCMEQKVKTRIPNHNIWAKNSMNNLISEINNIICGNN